MRRFLHSVMAIFVFITILSAQVEIADGYTSILELNRFDGSPRYPVVADEVHAGFDLDKDGNLEFIFLADHSNPNTSEFGQWEDGASVYVYEWNPDSARFEKMWSWADTTIKNGGASFPTMTVADLDGDGYQEIVLGIPFATGKPAPDVSPTVIYVFEFQDSLPTVPTATWNALAKPGTDTRPSSMTAGDVDGDGQMEVAVSFRHYESASNNNAVMIFSLATDFYGEFTQFKVEMFDTTNSWGSIYSSDITDLDGDGNKEVYFSAESHVVYEANGPDSYVLSFVSRPTVTPFAIQAACEGDIDGDGKTELIFGNTGGELGIWYNITDVSQTDASNEALIKNVEPGGCRGLTVGDFDNDGLTDIFMGGNYAGTVWRVEYKGSGDITDENSYTYEMVYKDIEPIANTRVYSVSFPGDNFAIKWGGSASHDMNNNRKSELLFVYEDGDSSQAFVVMLETNEVTGIALEPGKPYLDSYHLYANYPNPFNPSTTIRYEIPKNEHVKLVVYDMLGREVKTLFEGPQTAGTHQVIWDGTNNQGQVVSAGTYIYTLYAGGHRLSKTMTLVK